MPCFYCGKRVSLVRQLTDADFCSDDHRKKYQELTRMALDRLLDAGQRLGTPVVYPEAEPSPRWPGESVATQPRYEETVQPPPEARPAERPQIEEEEYQPRHRPAEPEPVYEMPPAEQGEPIPPEAFYFALLECEPQPVVFLPHLVELDTFEPSFNAPTTAFPPSPCGMRLNAFLREPTLRVMPRPMPAGMGPGSGDAFRGSPRFENLTPLVGRVSPLSSFEPPAQPAIPFPARPASMRCAPHGEPHAAGRAMPRAKLPRFYTARSFSVGFKLAALAGYAPPRGTGKTVQRPGEIGFMPFQATAYVGWPAHSFPANALHLAAHRVLSGVPVNFAARASSAPAVLFHAVPSCSCHAAIRAGGVVFRAELARVPLPRGVQRAVTLREALCDLLAPAVVLPGLALKPAAELEIGGPPPVAPERTAEMPRARAMAAAMRFAPAAIFSAASAALPVVSVAQAAFGIGAAEFEIVSHAAVVGTRQRAAARAAVIEAAPWSGSEAALPVFTLKKPVASLPAAASMAGMGTPAAMRRGAAAKTPAAVAPFTVIEPAVPPSGAIAAARRTLEPSGYAATSASVPAGGKRPGIVVVGVQYGHPEALIERPAMRIALRARQLPAGEHKPGSTPRVPVSRASAWSPAVSVAFEPHAQTPVCPVHFRERLEAATCFSAPFPAARKGSFTAASAGLEFSGREAALPEFRAAANGVWLPAAESATHMPVPVAGRPAAVRMPEAPEIAGPSDIRLLEVALKPPPAAGTVEPQPLQAGVQPAPRARAATWRLLPEIRIDCRTFFPPAPAPVSSAHLVPEGARVPLGPQRAARKLPSSTVLGWSLPVPPPAIAEHAGRTAAPLVLSASAAVRATIASTAIRSTFRPSDWIPAAPAAPAIERESRPIRPGTLRAGTIERGSYLEAAPRRPAAAPGVSAESPFAARDAQFPSERNIAAREALDTTAAATVLPQFKAGATPAARALDIPIRKRSTLLPEIRLDATLAEIARARHLSECEANPVSAPTWRDMARRSTFETATVPIPLTAPLYTPEGRVRQIGPFPLGAAGLAAAAERKPRVMESRRRDVERVAFELLAPIQPASADLSARHTLEKARPIAGEGRTRAGSPSPATATVVPLSTQAVELAGTQTLVFPHALSLGLVASVQLRGVNRTAAGIPDGWQAYGRESSVVEFQGIQSSAGGVRWPTTTAFQFAKQAERPPKAGVAAKADPHPLAEFAVPAAHEPALARRSLLLGSAPATKLAEPAVRQDRATTKSTVHLDPIFRPHRHPSRLPVFHTTVEKAHMPFGVFTYLESEDWEDMRTTKSAEPYSSAPIGPWIPPFGFEPHCRYGLGETTLASVEGGARPGWASPLDGFEELAFVFEITVPPSGAQLDRMDFDSIAESYEPRWRSALKSASGLFRGVLMVLCVLSLGASLTGCSGRGKSVRETIQSRAAVHIEHDFSKGLDGWYGEGEWLKHWGQDPAGFVQAGQLALYRPSQQLSDYHFEFLGQIKGRAIGWAFRAADPQNYYATQLTITKPGLLSEVSLVRYQVAGGQASQRVEIPLRMTIQKTQPFRVEEDVAGSIFTTSVNGEVVDTWSDDRLRAGAVGFFGSPEDKPNIYWLKVSNNDDFWGRLCSKLAPSN